MSTEYPHCEKHGLVIRLNGDWLVSSRRLLAVVGEAEFMRIRREAGGWTPESVERVLRERG